MMVRLLVKATSDYPVNRQRIREAVGKLLKKHDFADKIEVGVVFVGDRKMRKLNRTYLKKEGTTDVLSFPLTQEKKNNQEINEFVEAPDEVLRLGEIVISYPQARKQAIKENFLVDEIVDRLVKHGLLHLLGIHHDY